MQQSSIQFGGLAQERQVLDVRATLRHRWMTFNNWLDQRSDFYSRIAEFDVTRRVAIRIGVVLPLLMMVAAVTAAEAPVVAIVAASISGWVVYRLNRNKV